MRVGRIGADHDDDVGLLDRIEILRSGRRAEGRAQAVAGRRVADARAGIDIVVAEGGADQLLHQEGFFVGAARRRDAADRAAPVGRLDALELGGDAPDRFVPGDLAPRIGDLLADHRLEDALAVGGVAPGEAALDAGMAAIGLAVLVRHHAHDFVAAHLRLERAADAAIGAGRHHRMFRLADLDDRFLVQRRRSGRPARRRRRRRIRSSKNVSSMPGDNHRVEAAAGDGQREGALHFLAGAHAARADDAFGGIEGEIRIGVVDARDCGCLAPS